MCETIEKEHHLIGTKEVMPYKRVIEKGVSVDNVEVGDLVILDGEGEPIEVTEGKRYMIHQSYEVVAKVEVEE